MWEQKKAALDRKNIYVGKSHTQQLREEFPLACVSIAGVRGAL